MLAVDPFRTHPSDVESGARTTAEAVIAAARTVCAGLNDEQLTAALKLAYAHAGPARELSLAALTKRGSAMLAATTQAALLEGCLVAEKRQVLLEVLDIKSALTDGLKRALLELADPPAAAVTDPNDADSSTNEAAADAAEVTRDASWFRKRVQQLRAAELDALMADGGWLDPVTTRLRTALKASGWSVMMKAAAKISPTLVEVLRRTPCPAAAPKEHTAQAVARLLVSDGLARAPAHVWPLTAQRILGLIHEYQRLLKTPEEQLARRGLTKAELQLELIRNIHNVSHFSDVSRIALSKAVRIAVSKGGAQAPAAVASAKAAVADVPLAEAAAATAAPAAAVVQMECSATAAAADVQLAEAAAAAVAEQAEPEPEAAIEAAQSLVATTATVPQVHAEAAATGASRRWKA
ncbi:hypothetical protein HXX76_000444 [Chlamydomonas incerta]|uniref:Uncharacterized protein n=1 Tax=Chlamydomonas incerta TaxID=51695 RepID=A0A835WEA2_CHLIN|nr:hypothetical protein HXX76_000444 [Chlamydomonas incerta]|eukprot:KAG2445840.1 hypothetical protein HXX76_000444 [Chlamydomonas incerta]